MSTLIAKATDNLENLKGFRAEAVIMSHKEAIGKGTRNKKLIMVTVLTKVLTTTVFYNVEMDDEVVHVTSDINEAASNYDALY